MADQQKESLITGVDIGGSHITACQVDINDGKCREGSMARRHLDSSADADTIVALWASVIQESLQNSKQQAGQIGIAMPGPFDYENGISYMADLNKYDRLYGLNVKEMLADKLGVPSTDIRMINDATAFLLGEQQQLTTAKSGMILGVTLGTGLGSAWSINGQLIEGDLYKFPFRDGVAEDYVSARWLTQQYRQRTGREVAGVKEISDQAASEEAIACELFEEFGRSLAEILYLRFEGRGPQYVILGGNISLACSHFITAFQDSLRHKMEVPAHSVSVLGESAALIGSACLWR
jgi:glucokinase